MAGVSDKGLHSCGPWPLGVNNLAQEGQLPTDEDGNVLALREADNVDLDRVGWPRLRPGYALAHATQLGHSGWSHPHLDFALLVDAGRLKMMRAAGLTDLGIVVGDRDLSYCLGNDRVFFSNTVVSGMLTPDLQVHPWGAECPNGQPAAEAIAGFGLTAGQYQVAVSFTDQLGRESGSTVAVRVDVAEGGGIALTSIPMPQDLAATPTTNVWCTDPNDQVLRLYATMPSGMTSMDIVQPANGRAMTTQFLERIPPGQITRINNGRQYVASGRHLHWSPALRYGLTDRSEMSMVFEDDIDMMEPFGNGSASGLFVAAGSKTYWFGGPDPAAFERRVAHSSGARPRSSLLIPGQALGAASKDEIPVWISRDGFFCTGSLSGQVVALKDSEAVIDDGSSAAMLYRTGNGMRQLIATVRGARPHGLRVTDRAIAHVIRE